MSRIGKQPIQIPSSVTVTIKGHEITVKGPKGTLKWSHHPNISLKTTDKVINVERSSEEGFDRGLHGLTRTLVSNLIHGASHGFQKQLEIQGVGYRVQIQGKKLVLALGFSHPVELSAPEGIAFDIDKEKKNIITISGIDKSLVGQVAADIRSLRPPEPYKGKGIRYVGEIIVRKAGKAAATAAKVGG